MKRYNEKPLISIIVPVYNIQDYISECVMSLIGQTYKNIEIFLIDDGSTDESGKICDRFAEEDDRITVLHKKNGGLSDARNYGLDRINGDIIGFVDGDDWIHPQMYEIMQQVMNETGAEIVTCGFEQNDREQFSKEHNVIDSKYKIINSSDALIDIEIPLVMAWNKIYKKKVFDGIRYQKGRLHEDEFIIHRLFRRCNKLAVVDLPLYFYTVREGSIVDKMSSKRIDDSLDAFRDRVEYAEETCWEQVLPAVIKRFCDYCIDYYEMIRAGRYPELDKTYLDTLWESERDMVNSHPDIYVEDKYVYFAKSPDDYYKWKERNERINKVKSIPRRVINKMRKMFGRG